MGRARNRRGRVGLVLALGAFFLLGSATYGAVPPAAAAARLTPVTSQTFAGYYAFSYGAALFKGKMTVPTVNCVAQPYAAMSVSLVIPNPDGSGGSKAEVEGECSNETPLYQAFVINPSFASATIDVNAGDSLELNVSTVAGQAVSIKDLTTHTKVSVPGVNLTAGEALAGMQESASPVDPLVPFTKIKLTQLVLEDVTGGGNIAYGVGAFERVNLVDPSNDIAARPGALNSSNTGFTLNFVQST